MRTRSGLGSAPSGRVRLCILAAAALLLPTPSAAQVENATLASGVFWQTYRFQDAASVGIGSLDLLTVPFGLVADLGSRVRFQASGAWASGRLERSGGSEATLSGPIDTELRLSTTVGQDLLTLTAVGLLPTGVAELSADQVDLAGMVGADLLPFRVTNWGSGGGFGASAAVARTVGLYAMGVAAGYVVTREFDPLEGPAFRYQPGNQLHVRAALDRNFGAAGKGSIALTWQSFGTDQANGANLFQPGNRVQALGSYAFPVGVAGSGIAWAGWLHRAEGEFLTTPGPAPARNLAFGGVGGRVPVGGVVLQPTVELRVQNLAERESGYTLSAGAALELAAGGMTFVPTARGRFGSVELGGGRTSGFTGAELGVGVRFGG